ncbi:helicase HerA-like domain-containing protein [Mesobacterium sp. TK19101]|uniref:Helicase HerA-like domain-containing protein n=1 Tax=Mesobacterium hydrothermale TaxID=3111907 RepID=A0ABU6HDN0_9RHOB|nr:helicase HerA-like domain-containing protein [Mesobacterium sp. TK19101]MEC3860569.1 helicase HerA-like domain-containing protein [Mesobacterium sp. TK19101]
MENGVFVGGGGADYGEKQWLDLKYANRHGLIAGATGTGKTVTLQILAEGFANAGVPVFLSDVKGDLSGLAKPGSETFKLHGAFTDRAAKIGFDDFSYQAFPTVFWDLFGQKGHPVRTTVAEMGPLLMSRLLELSEAQEGILNIAFRLADEDGMPLLDLKDLQSLLVWVGENRADLSLRYGNISVQSVGAIQRRLLVLENQGGAGLFGEPALDLADMMQVDAQGRGQVNILTADSLMAAPRLYATFLLWLLSELFEELPEVGDPDKPKLVFFFDEAHLLFDDAPKALIDKVEQVARLIRSKGVGVYFITQNPDDIPEDILGQLGNRVQHALRAFTARDRKALRLAAETYRENPDFNIEDAIREVGVGEAVTSMLEKKGVPGVAQRTLIRPPSSQLGPITDDQRAGLIATSPIGGKYDTVIDRRSAYEILRQRAETAAAAAEQAELKEETQAAQERDYSAGRRYTGTRVGRSTSKPVRSTKSSRDKSFGEAMGDMVMKELTGTTGRRIVRGILGGLFKAK